RSFGLIRRTARSWASTFPVSQSATANSWLGWIFFASARRSPCLTPNWLLPAPHLTLCFRVASLPSALSCLRVSLSVMIMGLLNESAVGRGLDAVQLGVRAAAGHELVVRADLGDLGPVEHDDEVGHPHGRDAVRHQEGDAPVVPRGAARRGGVA